VNLTEFLDEPLVKPHICQETRKRIKLSVYAYAYEFDQPIVDDGTFDALAYSIDVNIKTNRPELDKFFRKEFSPDTGMWIHKHPELDKLKIIYEKHYKKG